MIYDILQGETKRLKMTVSKSQCCYIEHFEQRKNKPGFLKINQWCKKNNLSKIVLQNSEAHQLIDS